MCVCVCVCVCVLLLFWGGFHRLFLLLLLLLKLPQWGTADAEIEVPFVEIPEFTSVLPLKPEVGRNIAVIITINTF